MRCIELMTTVSNKARVSVGILLGVVVGALSFWLVQKNDARKFDALKKNALCVLYLPEGTSSASATFTTRRAAEMFHVGIQTKVKSDALSISISTDQGSIASASGLKTRVCWNSTRMRLMR